MTATQDKIFHTVITLEDKDLPSIGEVVKNLHEVCHILDLIVDFPRISFGPSPFRCFLRFNEIPENKRALEMLKEKGFLKEV